MPFDCGDFVRPILHVLILVLNTLIQVKYKIVLYTIYYIEDSNRVFSLHPAFMHARASNEDPLVVDVEQLL